MISFLNEYLHRQWQCIDHNVVLFGPCKRYKTHTVFPWKFEIVWKCSQHLLMIGFLFVSRNWNFQSPKKHFAKNKILKELAKKGFLYNEDLALLGSYKYSFYSRLKLRWLLLGSNIIISKISKFAWIFNPEIEIIIWGQVHPESASSPVITDKWR